MRSKVELFVVVGIFTLVTVGFIAFWPELEALFEVIVARFGLIGLFVITLIMDTIIQPIPPDILTVGYSMSEINILKVSLVGGSASVFAGCMGYWIGRFLGKEGVDKFIGRERYEKAHTLFVKYGFWAILIGAMSPIPFSAMSWSAGVFKMPWKFFWMSTLATRLPRFLMVGYLGNMFL